MDGFAITTRCFSSLVIFWIFYFCQQWNVQVSVCRLALKYKCWVSVLFLISRWALSQFDIPMNDVLHGPWGPCWKVQENLWDWVCSYNLNQSVVGSTRRFTLMSELIQNPNMTDGSDFEEGIGWDKNWWLVLSVLKDLTS